MEKIESNLDLVEEHMENNDQDWVHVTVGGEGNGKSTLNAAMSFYFDDSFSAERMHIDGQEFRNQAMNLETMNAISHDEAIESMYKREAMAEEVKKMIKFLRKCRYLQLFITLSLPSLTELDRSLWDPSKTDEPRVKSIGRVVDQGWVHFYSQSKFSKIETNTNEGTNWPEPDYRDGFPNLKKERPSFWEEYMEKKDRDISDAEEVEEEEISLKELAEAVKQQQDRYLSEYNQREYIDADLIEVDFEIAGNKAKKVKKKVEADLGINQ